eukprot:SAG31_NODE_711_length_12665_cov_2.283225_5_plen_176_part_00
MRPVSGQSADSQPPLSGMTTNGSASPTIGFGMKLFLLPDEKYPLRRDIELYLLSRLRASALCDNSDRDRSAGSVVDATAVTSLVGVVYVCGRMGETNRRSSLYERYSSPPHTIQACSPAAAVEEAMPIVDRLLQDLVEVSGRAKVGVASIGMREGSKFDTCHVRWRAHLGAYYDF